MEIDLMALAQAVCTACTSASVTADGAEPFANGTEEWCRKIRTFPSEFFLS